MRKQAAGMERRAFGGIVAGALVVLCALMAPGCGGPARTEDTGRGDARAEGGGNGTDGGGGMDAGDAGGGEDATDGSMGTDGGDDARDEGVDADSCVALPEVCDGVDNDCDGMTDEDLGTTSCGDGECRRTVQNCVAGMTVRCMPGTPGMETCDGLDNDCDGMTDEELGRTTCGMGACERSVDNCVGGATQMCTPGRPGTETCNGRDDDCDGMTDEDLGTTTCGMGACERTIPTCAGGMTQTCVPGMPSMEVCDGMDNNCDGSIDEGLGVSVCGLGECRRMQQNCVAGMPRMCVPLPSSPEVCNGRDDDCDGMVDEDLGTLMCGVGACQRIIPACMGGMTQTCVPGLPSMEVCDGLDNNCNGMVDEGNPGGGSSCNTGMSGICAAGTGLCMGGRVVCAPNMSPAPSETCNGLDDNCDGAVDNAPLPALCPAPTGAAMTACTGGGGCTISMCQPGTYDVDRNYASGCECVDDTNSRTCSSPTPILTSGTNSRDFGVGSTGQTEVSRIPDVGPGMPVVGDWFSVSFPMTPDFAQHGRGRPTIDFVRNDGNAFQFDVFEPNCMERSIGCGPMTPPGNPPPNPGMRSSSTNLTSWDFHDACTAGATNCSTRFVPWPASIYIRVTRRTPGLSCAAYQLRVRRL